ncbi:MAG: hypothetical protein LBU12_08865 [Deltaproteobacteria bacterium]|jgi:malate/lactate dehydrogenase|nr:hypothetical protein [Deltaproteobacteria bacterium]
MRKLGVVGGAGGLGSTLAFHAGLTDLFETVALVDVNRGRLETQIIDLRESFCQECSTQVVGGDWEVLADCDALVLAAAATGRQVNSRSDYLGANLGLVRETADRAAQLCPQATLISCTAPVDVFVMILHGRLGWDRGRILGFCLNDSLRFRWALSRVLQVDARRLDGLVLGEHGESQVLVWSSVKLDGRPHRLDEAAKAAVAKILADWYPHWQAQNSGRTTTWTSAVSLRRMLTALSAGRGASMASMVCRGEYGLTDVAAGLPVEVEAGGRASIVEIGLEDEELSLLRASADRIKALHAQAV